MTQDATTAGDELVAAIKALRPGDERPRSDGLRAGWHDLGGAWIVRWAESLARDVRRAGEALSSAAAEGPGDEGTAAIESALWRVSAAFEKLQDVIALGFGVPALQLNRDRRGIRRFEADRRENRKKLRELAAAHPAAVTLLRLDERIYGHRFGKLRDALTHSLAPILQWESLLWFELGEIDERGGVIGYSAHHLTPSEQVQGTATPPDQMFTRALADGEEVVALFVEAMKELANLLRATGELPPPPLLWRVCQTGEVYLDRDEAAAAAREASGYGSGL